MEGIILEIESEFDFKVVEWKLENLQDIRARSVPEFLAA